MSKNFRNLSTYQYLGLLRYTTQFLTFTVYLQRKRTGMGAVFPRILECA